MNEHVTKILKQFELIEESDQFSFETTKIINEMERVLAKFKPKKPTDINELEKALKSVDADTIDHLKSSSSVSKLEQRIERLLNETDEDGYDNENDYDKDIELLNVLYEYADEFMQLSHYNDNISQFKKLESEFTKFKRKF